MATLTTVVSISTRKTTTAVSTVALSARPLGNEGDDAEDDEGEVVQRPGGNATDRGPQRANEARHHRHEPLAEPGAPARQVALTDRVSVNALRTGLGPGAWSQGSRVEP